MRGSRVSIRTKLIWNHYLSTKINILTVRDPIRAVASQNYVWIIAIVSPSIEIQPTEWTADQPPQDDSVSKDSVMQFATLKPPPDFEISLPSRFRMTILVLFFKTNIATTDWRIWK